MINEKRMKNILREVRNFAVFFLLVAFVITCCTMLFASVLSSTLGVTLNEENVSLAAKMTFVNVLILSVAFYVIDTIRRKLTVESPVKNITVAAEKIMQGDFSVRVTPRNKFGTDENFNQIIECFNQMAEELGSVETLRTDFIANVSHEMKTPLAVMQNYGTLLQTPELSDEKRMEYAKGVTDGSRRLADMMTNILKLNRLENQQIYPQTEKYDLGEQLCECLLQYESVWEKAEIEIETDIEENVQINADAELLSLVWNNLFSNAFKFTEAGGTVSVTLTASNHHAIVKVADTGCGMTPEIGAHIFEKFYQGDTSHSVQGNGLGLALVKRVVDIMQGEIRVESTPGKGTIFGKRILFPHIAVTLVLIPLATVFLVYSMIFIGTESVAAYISYILAFYTLTVCCIKIPKAIQWIKEFKEGNKYARRWQDDVRLRVNVSLYGSLMINTAYAVLQLGLGFYHASFWYYSMAGYYISLGIMRFFLVRHTRRHEPGEKLRQELVKYRNCGIIFLVMNLALSLMIFFMVYWNRTFKHHEITTIAMAAYTFTSFTLAIINMIKYRKYNSPVYSASKTINMASACVSVLTLEATMLTTFGDGTMSVVTRRIFLGATGGAVSVFVVVMAIYMIVEGSKKLQILKNSKGQDGTEQIKSSEK